MTDAFILPLLSRDTLEAEGIGARRLQQMLRVGHLVRLRPGVYAHAHEVAALTAEGRAVLRVRALHATARRPSVASHLTAAALHGLPLWQAPGDAVHVTIDEPRSRTGAGAVRHRGPLPDEHVVVRHGIPCTSLARTVSDVARTMSFETAVCVADAALRTVAGEGGGRVDPQRGEQLRDDALRIARTFAHGCSRAERALSFADARAQLPGESISRIRLHQLGFRSIRLQVRVAAPRGSYYVDFALDDADAFGECDGRGKYRTAETVRRVLDEEKQREDWIRGTTGRRIVRWGFADIADARTLATRLSVFGVAPPV